MSNPNSKSKPNNRGWKGHKPNSKGNDKTKPKTEEKLDSSGRDNDPNWYFSSPELATQAAELSFQNYLGTGPVISNYSVPSIMTFRMNPSPGTSYQLIQGATTLPSDANVKAADSTNLTSSLFTETRDGINLMSTKLYTLLSTYSGRTSNYGPQDIGIMHLALGSLVEFTEYIRRAFGVAMTYNPRNRMLPLGLLAAMGVDGDDLMKNLANYRMRFNVAIARVNQIPILDNIGYLRKCREIYQKIYVDEVSAMAQYYLYMPNSVWLLHEESIGSWTHGSWLETVVIPTGTNTVGSLLSILERMINALLFSSTYNIVYSDLINLANKISVPFWSLDYLPENYVVMAEYNRNANLQMHNLSIWQDADQPGRGTGVNLNVPWNYSTLMPANWYITPYNNVYADARDNSVLYNPAFPVLFTDMFTSNSGTAWFSAKQIVDMDIDNPTLEDRIESLRFKVMESGYYLSQNETTRDRFFKILPCLPDHYCVNSFIYTNYNDSPIEYKSTVRSASTPWGGGAISQLKNAPLTYLKENNTYVDNTVSNIYGDLTFYTTIDFDYLYRLNRLIATGLFDFRTK